ncbi:Na(+)/H(+) antiporter subunit C [Hoyosella altamirensis]|uniref:Multicomponent Na+:H+ antiporter subunit C n=1 Tax=Hoyosella altamirensis TaxID=616997 RepID=A0A839RM18_9ACTN|nr:Na(+)/H(+) antiporter subunit C [Hoyosella altamirensis]MBB3037550.1 multicomponent Na+:H+ antiporter subunit C [Hoyosella altamirensis]
MSLTTSFGMLLIVGILFGCGIYLVLERTILKMLLGLLLLTNAVNLLIINMGGLSGAPPIIGRESAEHGDMADPLVQALILTAIVIGMGLAAFVIALIYRSFTLQTVDDVDDDTEDVRVAHRTRIEAPDYEPESETPASPEGPYGPPVDGSDSDFDESERRANGKTQRGDS